MPEKLEPVTSAPTSVIFGSESDNPEGYHALMRERIADAREQRAQARLEEAAELAAQVARDAVLLHGARSADEIAEAVRAGLGSAGIAAVTTSDGRVARAGFGA
ncbi:hypothetical protein [Variovorax rhizosphaerae]|uniref:Uncharacterized protein n=1 Tax=Variovorax rhizosphaerae TaxID=1836200 RepID=A0ABU8WSF3_9BURK